MEYSNDLDEFWTSDKYAKCVQETIQSISSELRDLSLKIHDNPEIGLKEFKAHAWLTEYLAKKGFSVSQGKSNLETAFVATAGNDDPKVTVGVVSEYDALPEIGHGCGHNLIAISGVASAMSIKAVIEKFNLKAQVKLFGTPSEEHDSGKIIMLEAGDFEGVDVCIMLHGATVDAVYVPFLSLRSIEIEFFGKSSHASTTPWEGINALDAAMQVYTDVGLMRQQMLPNQRIHGIIVNGGQAPNIIPEYTKSHYFVRAPRFQQAEELKAKLERIVEAAAKSTGCTSKVTYGLPIKDVLTNDLLGTKFIKLMNGLGVKYASKAQQLAMPSGSTDMGNITNAIPGIHPCFNALNLDGRVDPNMTLHTREFAKAAAQPQGHLATLRASKGLAMTAIECIINPTFLKQVKKEFKGDNV